MSEQAAGNNGSERRTEKVAVESAVVRRMSDDGESLDAATSAEPPPASCNSESHQSVLVSYGCVTKKAVLER